ncbi:MAG: sensor histidine kinase [Anaerolineae bacterium]
MAIKELLAAFDNSCCVVDRNLQIVAAHVPAGSAAADGLVGRPLADALHELADGQQALVVFPAEGASRVAASQGVAIADAVRDLQAAFARLDRLLAVVGAGMQELDEMKSAFITIAAHELRTPVTVITGYLELLLDGDSGALTDRQREYLALIRESADHLLALTQEMLDLLRIETGRIELRLQPVDPRELICSVIGEYQTRIAERRHRLTTTLADGLPAIRCDPQRASQILGNLLANAIKYTPPGGEIWLEVAPAAEAGFLQINVRDTGVGIPMAEQKRVFSRFFRASSAAEADTVGGFGFGLYVARALAELHGGRLWLESVAGRGVVVHVTFPITA